LTVFNITGHTRGVVCSGTLAGRVPGSTFLRVATIDLVAIAPTIVENAI
jgi:hypothetical protein